MLTNLQLWKTKNKKYVQTDTGNGLTEEQADSNITYINKIIVCSMKHENKVKVKKIVYHEEFINAYKVNLASKVAVHVV